MRTSAAPMSPISSLRPYGSSSDLAPHAMALSFLQKIVETLIIWTSDTSQPIVQSAAIFNLPEDVLSLIFLWGQSDLDQTQDLVGLISLKHGRTLASVCQHWRRVALNTVQLWSHISLTNTRYSAKLVERTKGAQLSVLCIFPSPKPEELWEMASELLPQCMDRMRDLRILIQKSGSDEQFWTLYSRPQALHELTIGGCPHQEGDAPRVLSKNVPLDKMSSLCSLSLRAIFLQQDLPPLPTLEHFSVDDRLLNKHLSVPWLLRSLPNIPNVQFVDVAVVITAGFPADQKLQIVKLPQLRYIKLMCLDVVCAALFQFLDIPNTATVNLSYARDVLNRPDTNGIKCLFSRCKNYPAPEFTLHLALQDHDHDGVNNMTISLMLSANETDGPFLFSAHLSPNSIPKYIQLFSLLPPEKMRTLELHVPAKDQSIGDWVEMTPLFPDLRKLVLRDSGGLDFLHHYTDRYLRGHDEQCGTRVNPRLSQLVFDMVDFELEGEKTKAYETLVESLDVLKQAKLPLEGISLEHCSISKGSVAELEELPLTSHRLNNAMAYTMALSLLQKIVKKLIISPRRRGSKSPRSTSTPTPSQSAAIFKLPEDVLSLIFLCGKSDYAQIQDHAGIVSLKHGRVLASVCQHWRRVAFNTVQLWSNITLANPRYAALLVERTKEAPLGVFCILPIPKPAEIWDAASKLVPKCADRIQNLRLFVHERDADEPFWALFSRPQALQRLSVVGGPLLEAGAHHVLSKTIPLDKMTSLCLLTLHNISLEQDIPPLPLLEHLIIAGNLLNETISFSWLLRALLNVPNVQFVDISVVGVAPLPIGQETQVIKLPQLHYLKLILADVSSSFLFQILEFPSTALINLTYVLDTHNHPDTDGMKALFSRYRDHPASELTLYLGIHNHEHEGKAMISLSLKADEIICPLVLSALLSREAIPNYIHLFSCLPSEKMRTLEFLAPAKDQSFGDWVEVAALFPNLRKLILGSGGGINFLRRYTERYLRERAAESGAANPQLSLLVFLMARLEAEGEKTNDYESVVESLDEMKRAELPLELLSLRHCRVSKELVKELEDRITVKWDGLETLPSV
ncbi:hypothetical protein ONZ45_g10220 [Pleurotus djamor]|nr:hypothetical protein ONZ45_g10220 [Pleurotus djamor]